MLLTLLLILTAPPPAAAVSDLTSLSKHVQSIRTLQANMVQRKEIIVLGEAIETQGTFAFARPRRLVIDLEGAGGITLIIDGDQMTTHYQALGRTDRVRLSADTRAAAVAEHLFLLLEGDPAAMNRSYDLEETGTEPFRLRLTPRSAALRRVIAHVDTTFDPRGFVTEIVLSEANGDRTTWTFTDVRLNAEIPAGRFRLANP
ncbi:MAG: outer membrane lipoprotein carrier protein LolA [Myxococcota bacterium]